MMRRQTPTLGRLLLAPLLTTGCTMHTSTTPSPPVTDAIEMNQSETTVITEPVSASEARTATNPLIWADVPDVAVIRVGKTYYMSSTTMHMSPGLPIMKSTDLVNWELVSYAYDILEDNDALSLSEGANAYGAGSWASSLRYHDGRFYVSTFSHTSGKTHIYITTNIENKPWREIAFSPVLYDHSLFFDDDGRVYMLHGNNNLTLTELKPDLSGIQPNGFNEVIIRDASLVASPRIGLPAEGTQMRKIDGRYYVCNITWPPGDMRTQILHRADRLEGPYEGRVILRDQGVAQGGLIDTPDGDWYAFLFKDYGAVGRVPFLVPMTWKDGWPKLGDNGRVPTQLDIPDVSTGLGNLVTSDEFDRSEQVASDIKAALGNGRYPRSAFPIAWQWNHNPDNRFWSLTDRPGFLRLTTGRVDTALPQARNTLTQRTFGPHSSASISMDISSMRDGDHAGLAALQQRYGYVGVKKTANATSIVMVRAESGEPVELEAIPITQDTIHLRIDCDFTTRPEQARFYYSLDGDSWHAIGQPLDMAYTIPHFMGYRFALFNFATEQPGGHADFDFFRISDASPRPDTPSHSDR